MGDFSDIKLIIAKNITRLRKEKGLTQAEVATSLNYTDKAVSKWERAESAPDIATLKLIAELYGVALDDIITEQTEIKAQTKKINKLGVLITRNKLIIPFLSAGVVWLVATIVFVFLCIFPVVTKPYLAFIYAVPVSIIVLIVFNSIWGHKIISAVIVSMLCWSIPVCIVTTIVFVKSWMLFLIPIPLQILIILWYIMRIKK